MALSKDLIDASGMQATSPGSPCEEVVSPRSGTRRSIVKVRVPALSRVYPTSPQKRSRLATLCSFAIWFLSTAGAAMVAAYVVPRFTASTATIKAGTPRSAVHQRASTFGAVVGGSTAIPLNPETGRSAGYQTLDVEALWGAVESCTRKVASLLSPEVMHESVTQLQRQMAPLNTLPLCAQPSTVPGNPIAAVGLATAIARILATGPNGACLDSDEHGLDSLLEAAAAEICDSSREGIGRAESARNLAKADDQETELDVGLAITSARLAGYTYRSCDAPDAWEAAAKLEADLQAEGLELVREIHSSGRTNDVYAYVARSADSIHVAFRGSCTLNNVVTDLQMKVRNSMLNGLGRSQCMPWHLAIDG